MRLSQITDRIYKTKNDIPYLKLLAFSEAIKGNETDLVLVASKVKEIFKTTDLEAFDKALHTDPKKIKFSHKVDTDLSVIEKFISTDMLQSENDIEALLQILVKPKNRFLKKDLTKINYAEAEFIITSFYPAH